MLHWRYSIINVRSSESVIMPDTPREGSLLLYKLQPARCARAGEKLTLELPGGESARVRPKDVQVLHPGPLGALGELKPPAGEIETAWEMLQGSQTTLPELAELAYGEYTPSTAWATWRLINEGVYFRGDADEVTVNSGADVDKILAARAADEIEKRAWTDFLEHARRNHVIREDGRFWQEVEARAYGLAGGGRILRALGREDTPEAAHQLLLDAGIWDEKVNPHPRRLGVQLAAPALDTTEPWPPTHLGAVDTQRVDLTALETFAIDDALTDTPDDAIGYGAAPDVLAGEPCFWVHIADAAAALPPDSALDQAARARGASLYLPEGQVAMLPPQVIALLGLGLSEVSRALSFALRFTEDGTPEIAAVLPSCIRVQRLTYEAADAQIDRAPFDRMYEIALAYEERRTRQGRVTIDLPEVDVRVSDDQVSIKPVMSIKSRTLVENAMIMTGEAVARYAAAHDLPIPFATQEVAEGETPEIDPSSMASMFAARRLMKRSQYRLSPAPHEGLGIASYAQVTSPLRRYLDLVVHQQLRAHLDAVGGAVDRVDEVDGVDGVETHLLGTDDILARIGAVEQTLGDVRMAESLSNRHWTLVYLLQHGDWRGEGVVVDHRGRQTVVIIPELGMETQVYPPDPPPLDGDVTLTLNQVDLPRLDARFRTDTNTH